MFSRTQRWAFTNCVAYLFFRTLAQPAVFWADSLLVNLCLYYTGLQRWSWTAVNNPSVSFLNSLFFNHVQERFLFLPSVCLKNWPCNVFPFQSATFSSFLCCLYCKGSLSTLGFKTGHVALSSISWLCWTYWLKLICCTNQLTSTFLPWQVYSTCICSSV